MLLPLLCSSILCLLVILGSAACWSCCCRAPPFHCRCSLGCKGLVLAGDSRFCRVLELFFAVPGSGVREGSKGVVCSSFQPPSSSPS